MDPAPGRSGVVSLGGKSTQPAGAFGTLPSASWERDRCKEFAKQGVNRVPQWRSLKMALSHMRNIPHIE